MKYLCKTYLFLSGLLNFKISLLFLIIIIAITLLIFLEKKKSIYKFSIISSIFIFFYSTLAYIQFDKSIANYQYLSFIGEQDTFLNVKGSMNFLYSKFIFGIDGINLFFVLLTTFLFPLIFLYCKNTKKMKALFILLYIIEFQLIVAFTTLDLLLFYISFESILIPMMLLINL